jgi:hypothetical protein
MASGVYGHVISPCIDVQNVFERPAFNCCLESSMRHLTHASKP